MHAYTYSEDANLQRGGPGHAAALPMSPPYEVAAVAPSVPPPASSFSYPVVSRGHSHAHGLHPLIDPAQPAMNMAIQHPSTRQAATPLIANIAITHG